MVDGATSRSHRRGRVGVPWLPRGSSSPLAPGSPSPARRLKDGWRESPSKDRVTQWAQHLLLSAGSPRRSISRGGNGKGPPDGHPREALPVSAGSTELGEPSSPSFGATRLPLLTLLKHHLPCRAGHSRLTLGERSTPLFSTQIRAQLTDASPPFLSPAQAALRGASRSASPSPPSMSRRSCSWMRGPTHRDTGALVSHPFHLLERVGQSPKAFAWRGVRLDDPWGSLQSLQFYDWLL